MSIYFPRKTKKRYKVLLILAIVGLLLFFTQGRVVNQVKEAVSESTVLSKDQTKKELEAKAEEARKIREQKRQTLLTTIQSELAVNDKYGVAVYDINNSEAFGVGELDQFHAASVMKLLVATTAFTDIEAGKYPLSNLTKGHLQQMINQSNNNSWEYFNQLELPD